MQLNTITKLLDIPNYKVVKIVNHTDSNLELGLDINVPHEAVCSGCGQVHNTPVPVHGTLDSMSGVR